ncbi:unnamed protein product [Phyllotreta striolata]|uniref:CHHC U11-48K-type domain-containing protein n=1 Tax=Phyllotreta striolata TaxID=444603 RepID=A0A9N9TS82_PHYSR|nr:unnamed protein product [Phyllotreta striolata]
MEIYINPEEEIQCPYDKSHMIRRKWMNCHLTKCKRNHPETTLVECDFNFNHRIPESELQYHHQICPDRRKLEIAVVKDDQVDLNKFPIINHNVPTEECWDNENVASYDPEKYCRDNEIIRRKDVASAAQRRQFRLEERKRIDDVRRRKEMEEARRNEIAATRQAAFGAQNRINLPDLEATGCIKEETPQRVAGILDWIQMGAKRPVIPKK